MTYRPELDGASLAERQRRKWMVARGAPGYRVFRITMNDRNPLTENLAADLGMVLTTSLCGNGHGNDIIDATGIDTVWIRGGTTALADDLDGNAGAD